MKNNLLNEDQVKEKPKTITLNLKALIFAIVLGLMILMLFIVLYFLFDFHIGYEGTIQAYALAVLFSIIGIILWAIFRYKLKKDFIALGFLIGGIVTILVVNILPSSL